MAAKNIGNWWLLAIKGVLVSILGVLILARPLDAILGIALFIGVFTTVGGLTLAVYGIINRKKREDWGWLLAEGMFDVLIGIAILGYPALSILLLTSLLGVWLMLAGMFQLVYYFRRTSLKVKRGRITLFNGIITLLLGFIIVINPLGGAVGLTLVIGAAAILYGLLSIYTAFQVRESESDLPSFLEEHSIQQ